MVHPGPGNFAECFVRSLPGFGQIGTLACHRKYPATSGNQLTLIVCANSGAKNRRASNGLRSVETFDDIAGANIARVPLGRADDGDGCTVVERWCRTKLTCGG